MASVPWTYGVVLNACLTIMAGIGPREVQNSFLPFYKFTSIFTVNYFDFLKKKVNAVKSLIPLTVSVLDVSQSHCWILFALKLLFKQIYT